jgi:hypothetical protein
MLFRGNFSVNSFLSNINVILPQYPLAFSSENVKPSVVEKCEVVNSKFIFYFIASIFHAWLEIRQSAANYLSAFVADNIICFSNCLSSTLVFQRAAEALLSCKPCGNILDLSGDFERAGIIRRFHNTKFMKATGLQLIFFSFVTCNPNFHNHLPSTALYTFFTISFVTK